MISDQQFLPDTKMNRFTLDTENIQIPNQIQENIRRRTRT